MKTVYLHIGTHKTGSTTLQFFLSRAESMLKEQGVLYPNAGRAGRLPHAHHKLAWAVREIRGVESNNAWRKVRDEIEAWKGGKVVISAEDFWPCTRSEIKHIMTLLADHRVEVMLYVRNPIDYILSCYKQHLLSTGRKSLDTFLHHSVHRCDYLSCITRWTETSGVEAFHLRLFDKVTQQTAGLEQDFIERLGIDFAPLRSFVASPVNVSPSDEILQSVRLVNELEHRLKHSLDQERWVASLAKRIRRQLYDQKRAGRFLLGVLRPWLYTDLKNAVGVKTWKWFQGEIAEKHRWFVRNYVQPEDQKYLSLERW